MPEVELIVGVVVKNEDGTETKHAVKGTQEGPDPSKVTAALGIRAMKQLIHKIKEED